MSKDRFKLIPACYAIIREGRKILLSKRYNTGFADGQYSLPAGHLEGNETWKQALCRELKEEIGITVIPKDLTFRHIIHRVGTDSERADMFFEVNYWAGNIENKEPNKCDDLSWHELTEDLPIVDYVRKALVDIEYGKGYGEWNWSE